MELIFRTLITSLVLQLFFFSIALFYTTDKLTDLSYGLTFVIIVFLTLFVNSSASFSQYLLVVMIITWALRLSGYLFIRILKTKQDRRFDGIRENPLKFAVFWLFQAIAISIILLPSIFAIGSKKDISLSSTIPFFLGFIVYLSGLAIETIADWQKYKYKLKPKNKDGWISSGLWKFSRHPNYFGEILIWWGIFIYTIPFLNSFTYLSVISPVFIFLLLLKVTGIPPLEKSYNQRFAKNKKYKEYKRKTSLLIPLPVKK